MDNMENIEIITTSYPIEYITTRLYGDHAIINSVYPDGTNIREYVVTQKQLSDYSKKELFIYNGLAESDREITIDLLDRNDELKIIDGSFGMELTYGLEELWLNPSQLLMITQNIRTGLKEYINSTYLKKEIDDRYEELKVELSELDAEIKLVAENAKNKTIVVQNQTLRYLEKYGFNVISLDEDSNILDKTMQQVRGMIDSGEINYIFILEHENINQPVQTLIDEKQIETLTFRRLDNITDLERDNNDGYLEIMNNNIELLKQEAYQ